MKINSDIITTTIVKSSPATGHTAMFSLPLPPFECSLEIPGAKNFTSVVLGEWNGRLLADKKQTWPWPKELIPEPKAFGNPPRRLLVFAEFPEAAPESFEIKLLPRKKDIKKNTSNTDFKASVIQGKEIYMVKDLEKGLGHYIKREDELMLDNAGKKLRLSLGFDNGKRHAWWQFVNIHPEWETPLCSAFMAGGHIYTGEEDRPMTIEELRVYDKTPFFQENMISAKVFIILFKNGHIEIDSHFANIEMFGRGGIVSGLPIIKLYSESGALSSGMININEGHIENGESASEKIWRPLESSAIFIGNRPDREKSRYSSDKPDFNNSVYVNEYVKDSEKGFIKGAARSFKCSLKPEANENTTPVRYLCEPSWYLRTSEFGLALPDPDPQKFNKLKELGDAGVSVFLKNAHSSGMSRGAIYRYLDSFASRHELSLDGNESAFLFRGAYMRSHGDLYETAMNSARSIADIAIDHEKFNVHYHGDIPEWDTFSQIYLRFGGLVKAWQETGNPWFLENAEAVANRWISINQANQPRKNMGRDTEPVEGILLLLDATGDDHYFRAAEKIAFNVAYSLFPDGSWRCASGIGPFWGSNALKGSPWNGSHLLSGIAEFLFRACPETAENYNFLTQKTQECIKRLLKRHQELIDDKTVGFHRAAGAFLPRRHYLAALIAGNRQLVAQIEQQMKKAEELFEKQGKDFYRTGHHCAGYLEAPFVMQALSGLETLPWDKQKT